MMSDIEQCFERITLLSDMIQRLSVDLTLAQARADTETAGRERAQHALRQIEDRCFVSQHFLGCVCGACMGLATIAAMARKGLA